MLGRLEVDGRQRQQMRNVNESRQAVVLVHIDCYHQIEPQKRKVSQIVLRQSFAPEMSVHATQTAKAVDSRADAFKVGQFDAPVIANHHVFNVAAAIDERADLPACFVRQLGELTREFWRHYLMGSDPPRVKLFYAAKLVGLQARGVSDYVLDRSCPPRSRFHSPRGV